MSYLNDTMLIELCEKHQLVQPYNPGRINPASIDLALGREFVNLSNKLIDYSNDGVVGHSAKPGERFNANIVRLEPGVALLATTTERVRIPDRQVILTSRERQQNESMSEFRNRWRSIEACTGELRLKSSAARNGLDHALAGWIDPGFGCGRTEWPKGSGEYITGSHLTLELHAHRPIELLAGKCYVQLVVATMLAAPAKSYQQTGRYVGESAIGAVLAKEE